MANRKTVRAAQAPATGDPQPAARKTPAPPTRPRPWLLITALVVVALFFIIYLMRMDHVVGMFQDDAWYVLLGKALATGQGYTLINSPTPGIAPLYPPAFPFLLSLVWRVAPEFPQNLWLLKSVSVAAMLLAGVACFYYFTRYRGLAAQTALLLAAAAALNPVLVFMATGSVMSECVFTLAQMATVLAVERCASERDGARFWLFALLAAAAGSWAFLTRSMAAALILAALIYLAKERLWKSAGVFAVGVALLAGGWTLYARAKAPTPEQRAEINNYIVRPYNEQFWDRIAGHLPGGRITLGNVPGRVASNLWSVASQDTGAIVLPWFWAALNQGLAERPVAEGGNALQPMLSLLAFALIVLGYIATVRTRVTYAELALPLSLLVILLWPFPPHRFLAPSAPLLLFYFVMGGKFLFDLRNRNKPAAQRDQTSLATLGATALAALLLLLALLGNFNYLGRQYADVAAQRPRWMRVFAENEANLNWAAANIAKTDVIASSNPALTYLYTGNKTTTFDDPAGKWDLWQRLGVRYLVHISPNPMPEPDANEARYRIIHRERGLNLRVVDLGPIETRPRWGGN